MKKFVELISSKIIENIESKENSSRVALQFILEELDAARSGNDFVRDRIKSLFFEESEYIGAMNRSWDDVDGEFGPQQLLLKNLAALVQTVGVELLAVARFHIVECVVHHYRLGRFYINPTIGVAKKPLSLFEKLKCDESKAHPHFKYLLSEENKEVREVISRWASGFEDRDNKFDHEFQTTFNSSFWEIYLYQCFKDLDMGVDFSKSAPDFTVKTKNDNVINIEAVTANHAHDSSPEWIGQDLKDDNDFLNFSCIRILNAIDSKHKKYLSSYCKLEHVKDTPFVIAVAPFEQSMFFMQNNEAIIRVLYGKGIDKHNNFVEVDTPTAKKKENISLELGMFTSEKYQNISAVIFSTTATIGKAKTQTSIPRLIRCSRYHEKVGLLVELKENSEYFETHLDGLQIHHNPYAVHKLPPEAFRKYEVTHYYYDKQSKEIDNQQKSYTMISRTLWPSPSQEGDSKSNHPEI